MISSKTILAAVSLVFICLPSTKIIYLRRQRLASPTAQVLIAQTTRLARRCRRRFDPLSRSFLFSKSGQKIPPLSLFLILKKWTKNSSLSSTIMSLSSSNDCITFWHFFHKFLSTIELYTQDFAGLLTMFNIQTCRSDWDWGGYAHSGQSFGFVSLSASMMHEFTQSSNTINYSWNCGRISNLNLSPLCVFHYCHHWKKVILGTAEQYNESIF